MPLTPGQQARRAWFAGLGLRLARGIARLLWRLKRLIAVATVIALVVLGFNDRLPWQDGGAVTAPRTPSPSASPTGGRVVVKGTKPKGAKACPRVYRLNATPARSAVKTGTATCAFAEEVRRVYVAKNGAGRKITLKNVKYPKKSSRVTMTCQGARTVTCKDGKRARVYLY